MYRVNLDSVKILSDFLMPAMLPHDYSASVVCTFPTDLILLYLGKPRSENCHITIDQGRYREALIYLYYFHINEAMYILCRKSVLYTHCKTCFCGRFFCAFCNNNHSYTSNIYTRQIEMMLLSLTKLLLLL